MRTDAVLLADIVGAAARIREYLGGMNRSSFLADRKTQAAVMHEIIIIGEAAGRVPEAVKTAHPEVPWSDLIQLRNYYVHAYHRVDYRRVWRTASLTIPEVAVRVAGLVPSSE